MTNTRNFFETARSYREALNEAWNTFDGNMSKIERFKGSSGYNELAQKYVDERIKAVKSIQADYSNRFDAILRSMRENATSKGMKAPSTEQLALLQVLRMREHLERDEIVQAGKALQDCPAAVAVLDEIAEKSGFYGARVGGVSTRSVMQHIDSLANATRRLIALDKPNSRREQMARASIHSPDHIPNALYSFTVDRDVADEREAMSFYGNVNREDFEAFADSVNG